MRAALPTWAALAAAGAKKENGQRFTVWDFMPDDARPRKTDAQLLAAVEYLNAAYGGRDLRPR